MLVVNQSGNATVPSLFNVQVNGSNDWRFAAGRQGRGCTADMALALPDFCF
jgi:hypothetical protein